MPIKHELQSTIPEQLWIERVSYLLNEKVSSETLDVIHDALYRFPDSIHLRLLEGKACLSLKMFSKARCIFQQLRQQGYEDHNVLSGLAMAAQKEGEWELAITSWNRCLELDPHGNAIKYLSGKCLALTRLGKYVEAEAHYLEMMCSYPDQPEVYEGLARTAQKRQDWLGAIDRWSVCISRFSEHKRVRDWLMEKAAVAQELTRFSQASEIYYNALDRYPKFSRAYEGLARNAELQGHLYVALDRYRDCIDDFPDDPRMFHWRLALAKLSVKLGDISSAKTAFGHLSKFYPQHPHGRRGLQRIAQLQIT